MKKTQAPTIQTHALEKVLHEQLALYELYTKQIEQDTESMTQLRIDELEQSNKIKNTLVLKIQAMDEARKNVVRQLAGQLNVDEKNIKMFQLFEYLSDAQSQKLTDLKEKLQSTIRNLKSIQEGNRILASASLSWMNGSMSTLKGMLSPLPTYNLQGRVDHPQAFAGKRVERQA